jgi:hypothetical protein
MDEDYKQSVPARTAQARSFLVTGVFGLSLVVALIRPDVATLVLLLLFFLDPASRWIVRART